MKRLRAIDRMQSIGGIDSNRWAIEMLSVKEENRRAPTSSIRITSRSGGGGGSSSSSSHARRQQHHPSQTLITSVTGNAKKEGTKQP
jgi:hypothetical protein